MEQTRILLDVLNDTYVFIEIDKDGKVVEMADVDRDLVQGVLAFMNKYSRGKLGA